MPEIIKVGHVQEVVPAGLVAVCRICASEICADAETFGWPFTRRENINELPVEESMAAVYSQPYYVDRRYWHSDCPVCNVPAVLIFKEGQDAEQKAAG